MDISLSGKIYVYYAKSVFVNNQKTGYEFIINIYNSDNQLIDSLDRIKKINKNILYFSLEDIKIPIKIYDKKYYGCFDMTYNATDKKIILNNITDIIYDKPNKLIDNKLKLYNYSMNKKNTVNKILDIINQQ
jgi:hypothetical protein